MFRVCRISTAMSRLLVGICLVAASPVSFAATADYETTAPIAPVYVREGGPEGWLGRAVSPTMQPGYRKKNPKSEYWRQDFQRGYIAWSKANQRYEAMPHFVRIEGDPRVYLVSYGARRWIPTDNIWEEFCQWRGIDFAKRYVKVLKSSDIYPLTKALDHVIRECGTQAVHYVPRGTYAGRRVASPWALKNWGLVGEVIELGAADMAKYSLDGPPFHPGWGGEARPRIEVLSFPKWITGSRDNVVWWIEADRDIRVRWRLRDWFSDTDTELHYRLDDGMPQKTPTQHGGNNDYTATIPASVTAGGQTVEIWIRAAERGKSRSSDDDRLEFWEPDVDAGFPPLVVTLEHKQR